jgi:hypothetical protein
MTQAIRREIQNGSGFIKGHFESFVAFSVALAAWYFAAMNGELQASITGSLKDVFEVSKIVLGVKGMRR